jgi:hypothetical protein
VKQIAIEEMYSVAQKLSKYRCLCDEMLTVRQNVLEAVQQTLWQGRGHD